jgi:hypothetical protein
VEPSGTSLTCVFSEPVVNTGIGISLDDGGPGITTTYASGSGTNTMVFTLGRPVVNGEVVTLDYASPGITDLAGNQLGSITGASVTNNSTYVIDLSPPLCIGASVSANQLALTFNESVSGTTGFSVESSSPTISVSSVLAAGSTITLTLNRTPAASESLRVSYTPGDVQDLAANAAVAFSILAQNNNVSAGGAGQFSGIKTGGSL